MLQRQPLPGGRWNSWETPGSCGAGWQPAVRLSIGPVTLCATNRSGAGIRWPFNLVRQARISACACQGSQASLSVERSSTGRGASALECKCGVLVSHPELCLPGGTGDTHVGRVELHPDAYPAVPVPYWSIPRYQESGSKLFRRNCLKLRLRHPDGES